MKLKFGDKESIHLKQRYEHKIEMQRIVDSIRKRKKLKCSSCDKLVRDVITWDLIGKWISWKCTGCDRKIYTDTEGKEITL